jgi:hypothetical protein
MAYPTLLIYKKGNGHTPAIELLVPVTIFIIISGASAATDTDM